MEPDPIEGYIERVTALQRSEQAVVDLRAVATELGISEHDLQKAEHAAEVSQARGRHFANHKLWDDAVREHATVAALRPYQPQALYELAAAHHGRWLVLHEPGDQAAARALARRCVELDPSFVQGYWLLEQLEQRTRRLKLPTQVLWFAAFPLAVLLLASLWSHHPEPHPGPPPAVPAVPAVQAVAAGDAGTGWAEAITFNIRFALPPDGAALVTNPQLTCEVLSVNDGERHHAATAMVQNGTAWPLDLTVTWKAVGGKGYLGPAIAFQPEIRPASFHLNPRDGRSFSVEADLPPNVEHLDVLVVGRVAQ